MTLSILWDDGISTTCRPGSVLSGIVQLSAAKPQPLSQVTITFAGRCKARVERSNGQNNSYYYSKGYLFRQRQQLHEGEYTFQTGIYTWPFRFVTPTHAERGLIQSENGKGDTFELEPPWQGTYTGDLHPLPASFNGPRKCSVEYYVKAELCPPHKGSSLFSRSIDTKVMLDFRPVVLGPVLAFRQAFYVFNQKFTIQTLNLLPEDSEERHSLRQRLKGIFQSSSLPKLKLDVQISIPRQIVGKPGIAVPLLVSVCRCAAAVEDSRQLPQSSVQVRRFELALRSYTDARVRKYRDHKNEKIPLVAGCGVAIWIQKAADGNDNTLPAYQADQVEAKATTNLGAIYGFRVPSGVTPNFSTYNIAHYHALELKLRLECAGEVMDFNISGLKLEITPEIAGQDPPTWDQSLGNSNMPLYQDSRIVSPPPYTDREEPPRPSVDMRRQSFTTT